MNLANPIARGAAVVASCAVLFSPALTNAAVLVCALAFLAEPVARKRFVQLLSQPIGIAAMVMLASVLMGAAYGVASVDEKLGELFHNRIWLFIPLFAALFADERGKRTIAVAFVLFCGLAAVFSFATWFAQHPMRHGVPGIVFRDHVTQGMGFSLAAFIGGLVVERGLVSANRQLRVAMLAAALVCTANVVFVSTGRSGHVALVFLTMLFFGMHFRRIGVRWPAVVLAGLIFAAIASSSTIRDRIRVGLNEATTISEQKELTSVGVRIVFWKNTVEMILARPVLGAGTGGFAPAYAEVVKETPGWQGVRTTDPHNQYLMTLAERGLVGLLALFATLALLSAQKGTGQPWRVVGLGAIGVWSLTNLVNSHFHTFDQSHLFVFLTGAFLAPLAANAPPDGPRES